MIGPKHLVGRGALPSTRLFDDWCRVEIGLPAVVGQGLECREEHFVGKELRRQDALQHKAFDQGVNHTRPVAPAAWVVRADLPVCGAIPRQTRNWQR